MNKDTVSKRLIEIQELIEELQIQINRLKQERLELLDRYEADKL